MNQAAILAQVARIHGDRPAVSFGRSVFRSYRELGTRAARLAGALRTELDLVPGDRVALAMKNHPLYLEILYAIWHAGLAAVPINAKLHPKEFAYILDNSGARACFATPDLAGMLAGIKNEVPDLEHLISTVDADIEELYEADPVPPASVDPDTLCWLFYTSGTTGRPKGAMITHRSLMFATTNYLADVDGIDPGDCMIHAAPMSHGSGLYAMPHIARGANNVVPESGGYDVEECLDLISNWPGASFFFAPTMVSRLINHPALGGADLTNLKTIVYGGGPMYLEDVLRAQEKLGPKLTQIYGLGEAPMTITGLPKSAYLDKDHPRYLARLGSAGFARTGVEVRVVDADGNNVGFGETGEIICRGDIVMGGYWQNPEATAKTIRDGWLWTGDLGAMDPDGYVTLKDRSKDMIISGGTNIYPREIEEVLLRHPDVYECAVVGRPHPDWGEEVVAFVVPHPDKEIETAELDALCLENIARFKRPKEYRLVTALTKNNYGKILKTELRDLLAGEAEG
ncbi:long-chain fatty acid--CoA ligase [Nisaea acidiphila]|uniref:3-methylmercaptopropionyl-CoA ligase n=1 Tax=Nisaea acidiphila TaxID=1862145 RepID=A0A9J7ASX7_9PROT|nr:long-chain fatty acid--CoA ligase [Nisaea acidiphila]UUX49436.1 long-chain fatty acid--CoA ligase [Nisaea acidiphila]